jgi:hypothetical protein
MKSIFEQACEEVMRLHGTDVGVRLSGTRYGLSFQELDARIRTTLREPTYRTPRCQRLRAFDVNARIKALLPR